MFPVPPDSTESSVTETVEDPTFLIFVVVAVALALTEIVVKSLIPFDR